MRNLKGLLLALLLVCCTSFAFTACAENEHNAITAAYAKLHNVDESEISFTCALYSDAFSSEIVDGVVFSHSQIKTFDVYNNGEFCSLQKAFDSGLVTHNNLLTLQKIYNP